MCEARLTLEGFRARTNGSIGGIVSGLFGGQYADGIVQVLCVDCNMVNYWCFMLQNKV